MFLQAITLEKKRIIKSALPLIKKGTIESIIETVNPVSKKTFAFTRFGAKNKIDNLLLKGLKVAHKNDLGREHCRTQAWLENSM